jgi:hypothetical protein
VRQLKIVFEFIRVNIQIGRRVDVSVRLTAAGNAAKARDWRSSKPVMLFCGLPAFWPAVD